MSSGALVIVGCVNAGKSTLARSLGVTVLEADLIRLELTGRSDEWDPAVWDVLARRALRMISRGQRVAVVSTGASPRFRAFAADLAADHRARIVRLSCSATTFVVRERAREDRTARSVTWSFWHNTLWAARRLSVDLDLYTDATGPAECAAAVSELMGWL